MDEQKRDDEMTADDGRVAFDKPADDELSDDEMSDDTSGYRSRASKNPDEKAGPDGRFVA